MYEYTKQTTYVLLLMLSSVNMYKAQCKLSACVHTKYLEYILVLYFNYVCVHYASLWSAHAWLLEFTFVQKVNMRACVSILKAINNYSYAVLTNYETFHHFIYHLSLIILMGLALVTKLFVNFFQCKETNVILQYHDFGYFQGAEVAFQQQRQVECFSYI